MRILTVSVHPDDETLGCGGTLLKYAGRGDSLHWLLVTVASGSGFLPAQVTQQAAQVKSVEQAYPFETLNWLSFPSTRLEAVPFNDLVNAIRLGIDQVHPDIVFVPNRSDVHSDHRIVSQAVQAVLKSFYMHLLGVKQILACEVISETDAAPPFVENSFLPNVFVDVSSTLERKLEIMQLYQSEVQPAPLPRSSSAIQALARWRGATIGVEYAEAFMLIRGIG